MCPGTSWQAWGVTWHPLRAWPEKAGAPEAAGRNGVQKGTRAGCGGSGLPPRALEFPENPGRPSVAPGKGFPHEDRSTPPPGRPPKGEPPQGHPGPLPHPCPWADGSTHPCPHPCPWADGFVHPRPPADRAMAGDLREKEGSERVSWASFWGPHGQSSRPPCPTCLTPTPSTPCSTLKASHSHVGGLRGCLERREVVPCFPPPSSSLTKPPAQHQLRLMIHGEPLFGNLLPEPTLARAASRPALLVRGAEWPARGCRGTQGAPRDRCFSSHKGTGHAFGTRKGIPRAPRSYQRLEDQLCV